MARITIPIGLAAACVLLAGCPKFSAGDGSDSSSGAAGTSSANCSPLDGVYRLTYSLRSGTCRPQPEELVKFTDGHSAPSDTQTCQAGGETMSTPCTLERDSMCSVSDSLTGALVGTAHVTGTLTEESDNTSLNGSFDVTLTDTTGTGCQASYDVVGVLVR